MTGYKKIKVGDKFIEGFEMRLGSKNLILLKGNKGYCMCGYLDIAVAERFGDVAVRITGVSDIEEAINSTVSSCTTQAEKLGISAGQPIKDVLKIIA